MASRLSRTLPRLMAFSARKNRRACGLPALAVVMLACTPEFGDSAAGKDPKGAVNIDQLNFDKLIQNFDMCVRADRPSREPTACTLLPSIAPAHIVALCVLTSTRMVRFDRQHAYGDKEREFKELCDRVGAAGGGGRSDFLLAYAGVTEFGDKFAFPIAERYGVTKKDTWPAYLYFTKVRGASDERLEARRLPDCGYRVVLRAQRPSSS